MTQTVCPICDFPHAEEREFSETVRQDGKQVTVKGLRHYVCPKCDAVFMDDEQSRANLVITQTALGEQTSFILPKEIKEWREGMGLTQRDAAALFGGGINAFSKYETGAVVQTEAMDNLLWVTMHYPGLIHHLATRHHVSLPEKIINSCGIVMQFSSTWVNTATMPVSILSNVPVGARDWFGIPQKEINAAMEQLTKQWHLSLTIHAANDVQFTLAA